MNFDRLRTFRVLSESLHVRRTAAKLHLSQSAVSQQVSTLEQELGVLLLERIGRRVFLTPAGRTLADEATKILAAVDRALESVRSFGTGETGRLRLGASTTPGIYLVPEVLGRLRAALPDVTVSLRIANSSEIERALVDNELDLGVIGEDITQDELFQAAIGEDRIIGVAAPSLFGEAGRAGRSRPRRLGPADLRSLPLLARETGSATRRTVDEGLAGIGVSTAPAFEFPSPEAQVRGAAAGLGLAFVSQRVAADYLAAGKLIAMNIAGLRLVRPITAAYHRDKHVSAAMRQLIDLARRQAHPTRASL
jgi:DNA-binding transcriptional LysR family regulator